MQTLKHLLTYPTFMGPVWAILVTLVGLPLANEIVQKYKGTRAESLLQGLALFLLKLPAVGIVIAKTPVLGDLLYVFAPRDKTGIPTPLIAKPSVVTVPVVEVTVNPPSDPPPATPLLALVLLSTLFSLPACTLAQAITGSYKGLAIAEKTVGAANAQFPTLDRGHRKEIVDKASTEQQGKDQLAAWDVTADRLVKSIQGTDATIKLCRDALAEISKGVRDKAQLAGWIATGIRLGIDLKDLLAASGVPLGGL